MIRFFRNLFSSRRPVENYLVMWTRKGWLIGSTDENDCLEEWINPEWPHQTYQSVDDFLRKRGGIDISQCNDNQIRMMDQMLTIDKDS